MIVQLQWARVNPESSNLIASCCYLILENRQNRGRQNIMKSRSILAGSLRDNNGYTVSFESQGIIVQCTWLYLPMFSKRELRLDLAIDWSWGGGICRCRPKTQQMEGFNKMHQLWLSLKYCIVFDICIIYSFNKQLLSWVCTTLLPSVAQRRVVDVLLESHMHFVIIM